MKLPEAAKAYLNAALSRPTENPRTVCDNGGRLPAYADALALATKAESRPEHAAMLADDMMAGNWQWIETGAKKHLSNERNACASKRPQPSPILSFAAGDFLFSFSFIHLLTSPEKG